jgi:hypothetical protein
MEWDLVRTRTLPSLHNFLHPSVQHSVARAPVCTVYYRSEPYNTHESGTSTKQHETTADTSQHFDVRVYSTGGNPG